MAQSKPIMLLCKGHNSPILNCTGLKKYDDDNKKSMFYVSRSEFAWFPPEAKDKKDNKGKRAGLIPYCKDCVQKIFDYYYGESSNFQLAVYYTCQKLDIPFLEELFHSVFDLYKEKSAKEFSDLNKKYMGEYIRLLNQGSVKYGDKLDFSYSDSDLSNIDTKMVNREQEEKALNKLKLTWGLQDSFEDYTFLQDRYEQYTDGIEFANAFHPDLYRDLCRDRLILRKISEGRYKGEENITQVQRRVDDLSKKLKIDEFKSNKPKTASELCLFEKIKLVDENNVADVYKEPTIKADYNKIRKYEKDLVLRPTLKTLINHRDYELKMEDLEQYDIR